MCLGVNLTIADVLRIVLEGNIASIKEEIRAYLNLLAACGFDLELLFQSVCEHLKRNMSEHPSNLAGLISEMISGDSRVF